jgi:hypothetical protein
MPRNFCRRRRASSSCRFWTRRGSRHWRPASLVAGLQGRKKGTVLKPVGPKGLEPYLYCTYQLATSAVCGANNPQPVAGSFHLRWLATHLKGWGFNICRLHLWAYIEFCCIDQSLTRTIVRSRAVTFVLLTLIIARPLALLCLTRGSLRAM